MVTRVIMIPLFALAGVAFAQDLSHIDLRRAMQISWVRPLAAITDQGEVYVAGFVGKSVFAVRTNKQAVRAFGVSQGVLLYSDGKALRLANLASGEDKAISLPGIPSEAAWSPKGGRFGAILRTGGGMKLVVGWRDGDVRAIHRENPVGPELLAWGAEGKTLSFAERSGSPEDTLFLVEKDISNGRERRSKVDGGELALARFRTMDLSGAQKGASGTWTVGSGRDRFEFRRAQFDGLGAIRLSPGGGEVSGWRSGSSDIARVRLEGKGRVRRNEAPDNDTPDGAVEVTGLPFSHMQDITEATKGPEDIPASCVVPGEQTVWFRWTPHESTSVVINLEGPYRSGLIVYRGGASTANEVGCDEGDYASSVRLTVHAGSVYWISASSFDLHADFLLLSIDRVSNSPTVLRSWEPGNRTGRSLTFTIEFTNRDSFRNIETAQIAFRNSSGATLCWLQWSSNSPDYYSLRNDTDTGWLRSASYDSVSNSSCQAQVYEWPNTDTSLVLQAVIDFQWPAVNGVLQGMARAWGTGGPPDWEQGSTITVEPVATLESAAASDGREMSIQATVHDDPLDNLYWSEFLIATATNGGGQPYCLIHLEHQDWGVGAISLFNDNGEFGSPWDGANEPSLLRTSACAVDLAQSMFFRDYYSSDWLIGLRGFYLNPMAGDYKVYFRMYTDTQNPTWQEVTNINIPAVGGGGLLTVTPTSGTGGGRIFHGTYPQPNGSSGTDLGWSEIVFDGGPGQPICLIHQDRRDNSLLLYGDDGDFLGPAYIGIPSSIENGACWVDGTMAKAYQEGSNQHWYQPVGFKIPGAKTVQSRQVDDFGQMTNWTPTGTWTATLSGATAVGLVPELRDTASETLTAVYLDPFGATNMGWVQLIVAAAPDGGGQPYCYIHFDYRTGEFWLFDHARGDYIGPSGIGGGPLETTACRINPSGASASAVGVFLSVSIPVTLKSPTMSGTFKIYQRSYGLWSGGEDTGKEERGVWVMP